MVWKGIITFCVLKSNFKLYFQTQIFILSVYNYLNHFYKFYSYTEIIQYRYKYLSLASGYMTVELLFCSFFSLVLSLYSSNISRYSTTMLSMSVLHYNHITLHALVQNYHANEKVVFTCPSFSFLPPTHTHTPIALLTYFRPQISQN